MSNEPSKPGKIGIRDDHFNRIQDGLHKIAALASGERIAENRHEISLHDELLAAGKKMHRVQEEELLVGLKEARKRAFREIDIAVHPDESGEKRKEYLSIIRSLNEVIRNKFDLTYEQARSIRLCLEEYLLTGNFLDYSYHQKQRERSGYRRLIEYFFEIDPGSVKKDDPEEKHLAKSEAESLWFAYVNVKTIEQIRYFKSPYQKVDPETKEAIKNKITVNTAIWSFEFNRALPIHRRYYNFTSEDEGPKGDIRKRRNAFASLGKAQRYFSTAGELVKRGLNNAFYFEKKALDEIVIYQVDIESGRTVETKIQAPNRPQANSKKNFSYETLEEYLYYRLNENKNQQSEISYQNKVLRWYIRSGLLDPTSVSSREEQSDKELLSKSDLSSEQAHLYEIYEQQYRSNIIRKGSYSLDEDTELDELIEYLFLEGDRDMVARVFVFDTGFFDLTLQDNSINYIYWIPLITGHPDQPIGGVFYLNCSETMHDPKEKQGLAKVLDNLTKFFSGLYGPKQMQEITHQHDRQRNTAAAVAIISRNISHNIGSHVMSYQRYMLSDTQLMLANHVLNDLVLGDKEEYHIPARHLERDGDKFVLDYKKTEFDLPYLKAKGHFDGYLQGRHDYIGAVASDTTFYYGAVNLREEILEYFLQNKLIASSESTSLFRTDYDHKANRGRRCILLERIAWSENFTRKDIHFLYDEGQMPDTMLSLPAGIVGRQALFSILENIIRNTAKHGTRKGDDREEVRIYISVEPEGGNSDFFKIEITDNSGLRAKHNLPKIQASLNRPLIRQDGSGQIDESQKGIKEMQISAGWMRGITPRDIHELSERQVLDIDYDPEKSGLRYTFYVRQAKKVLLVGENLNYSSTSLPSSWSYKEVGKLIDQTVEQQYDLALLDINIDRDRQGLQERLPVRTIRYDIATLRGKDLIHEEVYESLEQAFYNQWLESQPMQQNSDKSFADLSIGILDSQQIHKFLRSPSDCNLSLETDTELDTAKQYDIVFRLHNDSSEVFKRFARLGVNGQATNEREHNKFLDIPYIEGISGNNTTARLLRDMPKDWLWCLRIKESAMTRVMIIDERIWKEITDPRDDSNEDFNADEHFEYWKYAKKNIHIYTILPSKERAEYHELINLRNEVEAFINQKGRLTWVGDSKRDFHFISFHQGLLDKLPLDGSQRLNFFKKFRKSVEPSLRYYMHSGRSFNPDLPPNVGFIPLSSLDAALRDCKFVLTELLFAGIINPERR